MLGWGLNPFVLKQACRFPRLSSPKCDSTKSKRAFNTPSPNSASSIISTPPYLACSDRLSERNFRRPAEHKPVISAWPPSVGICRAKKLNSDIYFFRIEFAGENTCFVFISTRNVSAIDIAPLEQVAKEVNAELKAVIDSDKDQLCFFFVYST